MIHLCRHPDHQIIVNYLEFLFHLSLLILSSPGLLHFCSCKGVKKENMLIMFSFVNDIDPAILIFCLELLQVFSFNSDY